MTTAPITIIGTGLAGYTLAREWRKLNADVPLRLITSDAGHFYSKPMLSNAFAQGKTPEKWVITDVAAMAKQLNADIITHTEITRIDPELHCCYAGEMAYTYSQLILAWGATQRLIPIQGDSSAIVRVNDLDSYGEFRARLTQYSAKKITILGAGLIGCEFANDLALAGYTVDVLDLAAYPLSRLMPVEAGQLMQAALQNLPITWHWQTYAQEILPSTASRYRLLLANGRVLETDIVLSAIGLQPKTQLAADAGLTINQGIMTDAYLRTSAVDVYALGDCAAVQGLVLPYVMPLMHGARALAKTLNGHATTVQYPAMPITVKTPNCPTVIAPAPMQYAAPEAWDIVEYAPESNTLKALLRNAAGDLLGFVLMGKAVAEKQTLTQQLPAWLSTLD